MLLIGLMTSRSAVTRRSAAGQAAETSLRRVADRACVGGLVVIPDDTANRVAVHRPASAYRALSDKRCVHTVLLTVPGDVRDARCAGLEEDGVVGDTG